ncbi:hypothetical protein [Kingella oralis]|uniref:hypothetical protein n=1 Tax=Kingella oralis TaxID=505 RepID=UPI0034E37647
MVLTSDNKRQPENGFDPFQAAFVCAEPARCLPFRHRITGNPPAAALGYNANAFQAA